MLYPTTRTATASRSATPAAIVRFLVDTNRELPQVLARVLSAGGAPRAPRLCRRPGQHDPGRPGTSFYHFDGVSSTRLLSDPAGIVTDTYQLRRVRHPARAHRHDRQPVPLHRTAVRRRTPGSTTCARATTSRPPAGSPALDPAGSAGVRAGVAAPLRLRCSTIRSTAPIPSDHSALGSFSISISIIVPAS